MADQPERERLRLKAPDAGKRPFRERYRIWIDAAGFVLVLGFWQTGFSAGDPVIATFLLGLGLAFGLFTVAIDPGHSRTLKWILAVGLVVVFAGSDAIVWLRQKPDWSERTYQFITSHWPSGASPLARPAPPTDSPTPAPSGRASKPIPPAPAAKAVAPQPQIAGQVLAKIDAEDLFNFGSTEPTTVRALISNNSPSNITVESLHLSELHYTDDSMTPARVANDKFNDFAENGGFREPSQVFDEGQLMAWGERAGEFEIYYNVTSAKLDGTPVTGPVTIPSGHVSEILATFPPSIIDRGKTNAVAAGLMFDIVTSDGNIRRRICPAFMSVAMKSIGGVRGATMGPLASRGRAMVLWPPGGNAPLCPVTPGP
jgi:hypothetical protein